MANPAFFGAEYLGVEIGQHHIEWGRLIRRYHQIDILAARGHGKSGFFSYVYPTWQSWRRRMNRGLLISDTEDQVQEFFRIMREGIEYTDSLGFTWKLPALIDTKIGHLVPANFERSWTGEKIHFRNGSRFNGKTFGKRFRGRHVPWIVVDDPHGDDASYSEVARGRDAEFLERAIEPMLLVGGQLVVVGTPLHADDIHGRKKSNPEWKSAEYPAITRDDDGTERVLWAAFRPMHYLKSRERSMGTLAFRQEYLLIPASSEASIFPPRLFTSRPEILAPWLRLRPTPEEFKARDWDYYAGIDLALSASAAADFTVIVVLGVDKYGNRHLVELVRSKGLGFRSQLALIKDVLAPFADTRRLSGVLVEANQAQRVFGDELASTTDLPIGQFTTTANGKNSLAGGVPSLRTLLENGKLRFARGDAYSQQQTEVLIGELQAFSWLKGKLQGVGAHDDTVMALWIADQAVRQGLGFQWWIMGDGMDEKTESPTAELALELGLELGDLANIPDSRPEATLEAKLELVELGYVPETCTLPVESAAPFIWSEVQHGRSPCWGCREDRARCSGAPYLGDQLVSIPDADAVRLEAGLPPLAALVEPPPRVWADTVAACRGDEALARLIPVERADRIAGWNSLVAVAEKPGWVLLATSQGKVDQLYDALRELMSAGAGE